MKTTELKNFTVFHNSGDELYFENKKDIELSFTINFSYTLPCYPSNHDGFNNTRYCSDVTIYDYDGISNIEPFISDIKEYFFNPKCQITIE